MGILDNIKVSDANHVIATWHETLIAIWWGPVSVGDVIEQSAITRQFLRGEKRAPHLLLVLESSAPPPVGAAFDEFVSFSKELATRMGVAAVVTEGGGFRTAAIRGVAASLALALPKRVPYKFVGDVEQAVALIAPHLSSESGGFRGLLGAVETLRKDTAVRPRPR